MDIIKSPPPLSGIRNIICRYCKAELSLTPQDVTLGGYDDLVHIKDVSHKWNEDYRREIASGYRYHYTCPICEHGGIVYDHLENFREVGYQFS